MNEVEVKCPKCRFRYDVAVSAGMNEVACVCPRCGTPFTFAVTEGDDRTVQQPENGETRPETQENVRVKVPPLPQEPDRRQESQATSGGRQASQTPPPFTKPNPMPTSPYSPNYKRKNNGCLRNCLTVFIVSFVVLVFFVRNCNEEHSFGSEILQKNEFYDDSATESRPETAEINGETPPHWLEGTWRAETSYGVVNISIRGNQIRELLPDGEINRGTFYYKKDRLYCDFGEESLIMLKLNQKKQIIYYGDQPMVKQ